MTYWLLQHEHRHAICIDMQFDSTMIKYQNWNHRYCECRKLFSF